VIRKGGTDGDPVFRGMAASRLGILLDGEMILGGCGMRMDPPTAYVFPEAFDRITVLKGPQTVKYGPGNSAGVVLFRTHTQGPQGLLRLCRGQPAGRQLRAQRPGAWKPVSAMNATTARSPAPIPTARTTRTVPGAQVHSRYDRWSVNGAVGLTPDENTRLELSFAKSDGHAAYADRSMDGTAFDRTNVGLKFEKSRISPLLAKLEGQIYRNYVDHVMDNYSLRWRRRPPAGWYPTLTVKPVVPASHWASRPARALT
jgi:iron complex outermembrane receptor protein